MTDKPLRAGYFIFCVTYYYALCITGGALLVMKYKELDI